MKTNSTVIVARLALVLLWVAALGALDLTIKYLVITELMSPPRVIPVTPFFNLMLAYNPGVSFGLFSDTMGSAPRMFAALQGVIVVGFVIWAVRAKTIAERVSVTVMAGGASGNVVDRFWNLNVTDYLDFHAFGWSWPAFNLADVFIVCGTLLLVATSILQDGRATSPAKI